MSVIVVGAGISGLLAARRLTDSCRRVTLLEKAAVVGGRLATPNFGGGTFDSGAQFFTVRSASFQAIVAGLQNQGVVREWFRGQPGGGPPAMDRYPRFCGSSGMQSVAAELAAGLDIRLEAKVVRAGRQAGQWNLTLSNGETLAANVLLLTCPIPQSLAILRVTGVRLPPTTESALSSVSYAPCMALMALLEGPSRLDAPGALALGGEVIEWIADNSRKGIAPRPGCITLHSSSGWASANFMVDDQHLATTMLAAAGEFLGSAATSYQLRRWRYAKALTPLPDSFLFDVSLGIVFAGDAFGAARVEGAALSGLAAAEFLLRELGEV